MPKATPMSQLSLAVDLPGFMKIDAGNSLGIAAIHSGLRLAADRTDTAGAIVVGITNYVGTTGSLGVYGAELAERGVVSVLSCNSEFAVAPHGSRRAVLGTNPLAVSLPAGRHSFIADFATAAWSYGSIKAAMVARRRLPEGIVQTEDGRASTDPNDADNGSQLPMAGHKGFGLGMAIELLCGPLIGGKAGRDAVSGSDGFFGVLVRVDVARSSQDVLVETTRLIDEVKRGPFAAGFSEIRIPGERAGQSEESSSIRVSDDVLKLLTSES